MGTLPTQTAAQAQPLTPAHILADDITAYGGWRAYRRASRAQLRIR